MPLFDLAILSGGKGRQFQSEAGPGKDKALARVSGQTILEILINRFLGLGSNLLLICGSLERCKRYRSLLRSTKEDYSKKIKFIPDFNASGLGPGPLRGILTGIQSTISERIVTIPNDMPFLFPDHILPLVEHVANAEVCTPIWPNKKLLPLIAAYKPGKLWQFSSFFGALKRNRADDPIRAAQAVCFLPLLAEEKTTLASAFLNINTMEELVKAQKNFRQFPVIKSPYTVDKSTIIQIHDASHAKLVLSLVKSHEDKKTTEDWAFQEELESFADCFRRYQMHFWEALSCELLGNSSFKTTKNSKKESFFWYGRAAKSYNQEHTFWMNNNQPFLALHCLLDQIRLIKPDSREYHNIQRLIRRYKTELFENEP